MFDKNDNFLDYFPLGKLTILTKLVMKKCLKKFISLFMKNNY